MKSKHAIKNIFLLLTCFSVFNAKAQDSTKVNQPAEITSLNKIRLTLIGLGFEREQKVGKLTSVYFGAGAEGTLIYKTNVTIDENYRIDATTDTDFKVYPGINAGLRHYFNLKRRIEKGKKTRNNSGGYVGFDALGVFSTNNDDFGFQINLMPHWGFQTSLGKKANFELCLGPMAAINKFDTYYGIGGRLGFSFLL